MPSNALLAVALAGSIGQNFVPVFFGFGQLVGHQIIIAQITVTFNKCRIITGNHSCSPIMQPPLHNKVWQVPVSFPDPVQSWHAHARSYLNNYLEPLVQPPQKPNQAETSAAFRSSRLTVSVSLCVPFP